MRQFAIFILCIEIYASLRVGGTKCGNVKCSSVSMQQQSGTDERIQGEALDQLEDDVQNDKYACCACGGATYDITFIGKWTKATYPQDFPGIMARWSPLIGASHSKEYIVWEYGGMASPGVTTVGEWGAVDKLEKEMKRQGENVFSIVKTRMLYRSQGQVSTTFKADSRRNLVSVLAKITPSPDWNVGADRINMCDRNCTWRKQIIKDLYPWDAGTDDGITFTSANRKSEPQQPIQNITRHTHQHPKGSFPDRDDSDVIRPFGQIKLQLMRTSGACSEPRPPPFPGIADRVHCEVSRWSSWLPCSVTCGHGVQHRGRAITKKPMNDGIPCPKEVDTRPCILRNCSVGPSESPKENCKLTLWSSWSGCRGTCNRGGRFRTRTILQKSGPGGKLCKDFSLIKWKRCKLQKCPSLKINDCIVTGWSPWTSCSKKCNRGRKYRIRKIVKSERNDGASCPTKLRERRKCVPVRCPA